MLHNIIVLFVQVVKYDLMKYEHAMGKQSKNMCLPIFTGMYLEEKNYLGHDIVFLVIFMDLLFVCITVTDELQIVLGLVS